MHFDNSRHLILLPKTVLLSNTFSNYNKYFNPILTVRKYLIIDIGHSCGYWCATIGILTQETLYFENIP